MLLKCHQCPWCYKKWKWQPGEKFSLSPPQSTAKAGVVAIAGDYFLPLSAADALGFESHPKMHLDLIDC